MTKKEYDEIVDAILEYGMASSDYSDIQTDYNLNARTEKYEKVLSLLKSHVVQ